MRVVSCLFTEHNLWLVALAAIVCVSGCAITFSLFNRARERTGLQKHGWSFLTAVAAGSSIWCTHFIAMLAYEVTVPVTFDPLLTMASLVVAILGCAVGFGLCAIDHKRFRPELCGAIVGITVATMHYTGMAAYHVYGLVEWSAGYIAASVAIAAAVSALAVREDVYRPRPHSKYIAVALFVVAIVGLHFTGMAAVQVTPMAGLEYYSANQPVFAAIAVAVAGVGLMVIGTGIAAYLIDERVSADAFQRLQHMALNDALTGLPNRVHYTDYLDNELERARTNAWTVAVVGIDLDRFKEINDLHGHEAGDEFVARVGGDEFAAVKRYASMDDLHDFTARLEKAVHETLKFDAFEGESGGSIGVALFPQDGADVATLISNADLAMYRAKADKDRTICFYEKQMDDAARARKSLTAELRRATENGEFELHYQVQNMVHSGEISGYEVLLRWRHAQRGMVSPAEFIPIAEECGAIVEIGEWVLRTACREALIWASPYKIAVNVSAVQLTQGDFAHTVHAILVETGFPPSRLEIEITESAIISDKARALHTLRRIRALGVTVAIDDFGAGYSSLETLRTFPFDKIKLDRSFAHGLEHDVQAKAIVRAVLALGKSLEIPVLAEGVETHEQLSILRTEGCSEAQGYLLGRPGRDPMQALPELAKAS
jgi:predicted signal transduction protein with EAL and GGDEF domain